VPRFAKRYIVWRRESPARRPVRGATGWTALPLTPGEKRSSCAASEHSFVVELTMEENDYTGFGMAGEQAFVLAGTKVQS